MKRDKAGQKQSKRERERRENHKKEQIQGERKRRGVNQKKSLKNEGERKYSKINDKECVCYMRIMIVDYIPWYVYQKRCLRL